MASDQASPSPTINLLTQLYIGKGLLQIEEDLQLRLSFIDWTVHKSSDNLYESCVLKQKMIGHHQWRRKKKEEGPCMSRQERAGSYLATKLVPETGRGRGCLTRVLWRAHGLANILNSDFSLQDHKRTNFYCLNRQGRGHRLSSPFKSKTAFQVLLTTTSISLTLPLCLLCY